jgi:hypothetical protein
MHDQLCLRGDMRLRIVGKLDGNAIAIPLL